MRRLLPLVLFLLGCIEQLPTPPEPTRASLLTLSWGLDRIDQRSLPLDGSYMPGTGQGVTIYVVDTGIDYAHPEFGGRAVPGFDVFGGNGGATCHGHGTRVASVAGGDSYGVASGATLVSVKVFGCNGTASSEDIVAGLDWIAANGVRPGVVNASFAEFPDEAIDAAVASLWTAGFLVVAGAGNDAGDACDLTPASVPVALTVGATRQDDSRWPSSNSGLCIDLYAPGADITSAEMGGGSITSSGTSMATPHVTGLAALYLAAHPNASPQEVTDAVLARATKGVVADAQSNAPHLVYSGTGTMEWTPPPPLAAPMPLGVSVTGSHKSGSTVYAHLLFDWADVGVPTYRYELSGFAPLPTVGSQATRILTAGSYQVRARAETALGISPWIPWVPFAVCTSGGGKNGSAWLC